MTSIGFKQIDMSVETFLAISPSDHLSVEIIGIAWAGTAYAIGLLWTALALIDRWRGPHGEGNINFISVIAAIILEMAVVDVMGGWSILEAGLKELWPGRTDELGRMRGQMSGSSPGQEDIGTSPQSQDGHI
ncbi:hypothetical protein diail_3234 [Diaporthe ilicicola]|nr:hypothetical protein diail_3234 [Diaporthe ilicicola]